MKMCMHALVCEVFIVILRILRYMMHMHVHTCCVSMTMHKYIYDLVN